MGDRIFPEAVESPSMWRTAMRLLREFLQHPRFRRLRWILFIGLFIRLLLAPFTSWGYDTPAFVTSGLALLITGTPYGTPLSWSNPPFGPLAAAPFLAPLVAFVGAQNIVPQVISLFPAATAAKGISIYVPIPLALLAWKLPLIAADTGTALLLYHLGRKYSTTLSPDGIATAWFLNPLVIWVSSVHGEVDSWAALFVVAALTTCLARHWTATGLLIALGTFSKGYPLILLPFVALVIWNDSTFSSWRQKTRLTAQFLLGIIVGSLAFVPFWSNTQQLLTSRLGAVTTYRGLTLLGFFHAGALPAGTPWWLGWYYLLSTDLSLASTLFVALRIWAILSATIGFLAVAWRLHRLSVRENDALRLHWLGMGILIAITGLLLAYSAPQSENLLALLPFLLLVLPREKSAFLWGWALFLLLSAIGLWYYWVLLTPLAYFYPLAILWGPSAIATVNAVVETYVTVHGLQGAFWLIASLAGGATILAISLRSVSRVLPERNSILSWWKGVWYRVHRR